MLKNYLVALLCPAIALGVPKKNRRVTTRGSQLCSLHVVKVEGNSAAALGARKALERRTWVKLAKPGDTPDAVLHVSETRVLLEGSESISVTGILTRGDSIEDMWSLTTDDCFKWSCSAEGKAERLLFQLNRDAGCQR